MRSTKPIVLSCLLTLVLVSATEAGILLDSPVVSTTGPGIFAASAITSAGNNYPATNSRNIVTGFAILTGTSTPVDAVFRANFSGGSAQYLTTIALQNSTFSTLSGYQFELGTGTGANFQRFTTGTSNAPLANFYESTPGSSSDAFSQVSDSGFLLTYSGGSLQASGNTAFTFNLVINNVVTGTYDFTLRQTANPLVSGSVPEPASWSLLAIGTSTLAWVGKRTRRKNLA